MDGPCSIPGCSSPQLREHVPYWSRCKGGMERAPRLGDSSNRVPPPVPGLLTVAPAGLRERTPGIHPEPGGSSNRIFPCDRPRLQSQRGLYEPRQSAGRLRNDDVGRPLCRGRSLATRVEVVQRAGPSRPDCRTDRTEAIAPIKAKARGRRRTAGRSQRRSGGIRSQSADRTQARGLGPDGAGCWGRGVIAPIKAKHFESRRADCRTDPTEVVAPNEAKTPRRRPARRMTGRSQGQAARGDRPVAPIKAKPVAPTERDRHSGAPRRADQSQPARGATAPNEATEGGATGTNPTAAEGRSGWVRQGASMGRRAFPRRRDRAAVKSGIIATSG
jgi:hypothetical protein